MIASQLVNKCFIVLLQSRVLHLERINHMWTYTYCV